MTAPDVAAAGAVVLETLASPLFRRVNARGTSDAARAAIGTRCPFCGARIVRETVRLAPIVPAVFMPPMSADPSADRFALCATCAAARGAADLIDAPDAIVSGALMARRAQLMVGSWHHVTAAPPRSDERINRILAARCAQPRAHLVAALCADGGVVIGWSVACGGPWTLGTHAARLRSVSSAKPLPAPSGLTLFHVPADADALAALWSLIEAGALVSSAAPVVEVSADDWRTAWSVHYSRRSDHARRVDPRTLWPIPVPARVMSLSQDALRKRAAYTAHAADARIAARWAEASRVLASDASAAALGAAYAERCALRADARRLGLA